MKSPQQWKSPLQWHSPPRHSNTSYKGSPSWRNDNRLTSSQSGADSPDWRSNGGASPRGSASPNSRHRDKSSPNQDGSIEKALKNLTTEFSVIGNGLKTLGPTLDNGFASVQSDFNLGFQSFQKSLFTFAVGSPERPSIQSQFKSSPGSTPRRRSPDSPIYDRSRVKCFSCRDIFRMSVPVVVKLLALLCQIGLRWFVLAARSWVIINSSVHELLHLQGNCLLPLVSARALD